FGVEVPLRALFEAPTVAALAARIEALGSAGAAAAPPIERAPRDAGEGLPLSFAQRRLWFIQQLDPASSAYHVPHVLRLRGRLDAGALERALGALAGRHETLRTVFAVEGGEPVQRVGPALPVRVPTVDLAGLGPKARAEEARRLGHAEAARPFDLARGPLLRARLLRLGRDEHVLGFTMHHIVSDGWSVEVLTREVSALYGAFSRGEEPRLPELPVQYADYAAWQRARLAGETLDAQLAFWREQLRGAPPLLELPTRRPRSPLSAGRGAAHPVALPDNVAGALRALARREAATPFMVLLAAWQALLARWSGQDDVVVGTPIAGRTRVEVEGLIGFFVNTLALRARPAPGASFRALLSEVRESTLGAYQHQELPFEKLVAELGLERSTTHTPLFQTMFTLQDARRREVELAGLEVEADGAAVLAPKFELSLDLEDRGGSIAGALSFRADLFDAAAMQRMAGHYATLLEQVAAAPERLLGELRLLSPAEERLLAGWGAGPALPAADGCLHELFAEQARRTPGATAVSGGGGGEGLSYAALDAGANRIAHALRALGVGPETRVGLCLERGPELAAAALGILKAGGAYVPLDPAYPPERLGYVLADSGARVLLTRTALAAGLPPFTGHVLRLDRAHETLAAGPDSAPESGVDARNTAYVVYTSGSTGRPKGVAVEHAGLAATLLAARDTLGFGAGEVVPVLASPAFDIWALEVFAPLLAGGEARILARETVHDVGRLVEELGRADAVHAVPALMRETVRRVRAGAGTLPRMRRVLVGGDAVAPDLLAGVQAAFPAAQAWVLYGPTEGTMICAATLLRGDGVPEWRMMGRPLPGAGMYVCDARGGLQPAGVAGELWLGGA
ncbi:MAG TPA: condensation domain-containing protein, partial [Longimicrobiaceae bacterium]|nr:condensation domain-containing protein [Longimicrobiaceae bacterium]